MSPTGDLLVTLIFAWGGVLSSLLRGALACSTGMAQRWGLHTLRGNANNAVGSATAEDLRCGKKNTSKEGTERKGTPIAGEL